jgi:hypothetical protein
MAALLYASTVEHQRPALQFGRMPLDDIEHILLRTASSSRPRRRARSQCAHNAPITAAPARLRKRRRAGHRLGVEIRHTRRWHLSDRRHPEVPLLRRGPGSGGTSRFHVLDMATISGWRAACSCSSADNGLKETEDL